MKRPNFLVFMTDHQRGDTQPPLGLAKTPNLERLFQNGVAFRQAYCPSPHCCPSRATFFSGLYPSEHGVWNNVDVPNTLSRGLYDGVRLFSEDLKENGYRMLFSGKWHVSAEEGPDSRGFELVYHKKTYQKRPNVPDTSEWELYKKAGGFGDTAGQTRREGEILRPYYPDYQQYGAKENPFGDTDVAEHACQALEQVGTDQPFFLFVGPLGPHDPYIPPQRFLDLYDPAEIPLPESFSDDMDDKPALYRRTRDRYAQLTPEEHRESIRRYLAFCSYEDWLFGQLLNVLEKRNLLEDTVVVYVSDHGDYVGAHRLWAKGLPCFQEAYHICSVVGYGGVKNPGRTEDALVSLADYAPTFLELAGIPCSRRMAGRSLAPFLRGEQPEGWRTRLFTQSNGNEVYGIQRAVFGGRYKYVFNAFDYDELYDLQEDPHETVNLIRRPDLQPVVKELCRELWKFAYENSDNIVNPYIMTALAPYGPGIAFSEEETGPARA
ncbi:MAG TPA: sulfatase-like hydrolase/transferase [Candidatus Caccousia avistercoris]|nr:sulfatase-like hydrolase/transferase [Candidatus Caccousia avistercoris]